MGITMRIIIKECRKIFDIRIILILLVFTFLSYMGMELKYYPSGGQCTDSKYDIPYMASLVEKLGGTLSLKDWGKLEKEAEPLRREKEKAYEEKITKSKILESAAVKNYNDMKKMQDALTEAEAKGTLSKNEEKIFEEMERIDNEIIFHEKEKICFELQALENMMSYKGHYYGVSKTSVKEMEKDWKRDGTKLYARAMKERVTKTYISLLPEGVMYILSADMQTMAKRMLIGFFVLIIPYQIRERMRGVTSLSATTYTGRKVFLKQLFASILSCLFVGIIWLLSYLGIFLWKGLGTFFSCPAGTYAFNNYWADDISFGAYMAVYMGLVLLAGVASVVIIWLVGRLAVNYIAGIALSIPVGGFLIYWSSIWFMELFAFYTETSVPLWELWAVCSWVVVVCIVAFFRLLYDKRRDIV